MSDQIAQFFPFVTGWDTVMEEVGRQDESSQKVLDAIRIDTDKDPGRFVALGTIWVPTLRTSGTHPGCKRQESGSSSSPPPRCEPQARRQSSAAEAGPWQQAADKRVARGDGQVLGQEEGADGLADVEKQVIKPVVECSEKVVEVPQLNHEGSVREANVRDEQNREKLETGIAFLAAEAREEEQRDERVRN